MAVASAGSVRAVVADITPDLSVPSEGATSAVGKPPDARRSPTLLGKARRTGRVTEKPAEGAVKPSCPWMRGSMQIREVDAGSCNGCELEVASMFGPVYDAEHLGMRLVASPRHADVLLVTGPVTLNMREALERTYEATPEPKVVVALGDCAIDGGVFSGGYAVEGPVGDVLPVDLAIPGCPPAPADIIRALRGLNGR